MKKILALFVLTCLIATALCGCGVGVNGKSAYESALDAGFSGSVNDWLNSLKGADGKDDSIKINSDGFWEINGVSTNVKAEGEGTSFAISSGNQLEGRTIVNFGDSIFGNYDAPESISSYIEQLTGATVYNVGFGGCRMGKHQHENWTPFSMYSLADAIVSGDFSLQDSALEGILDIDGKDDPDLPERFPKILNTLKSIDFNEVDIITIAYGTNDFTANNRKLYTSDRYDLETYAGALRYTIETITEAYPHLSIFICTPTYRFWPDKENNYAFIDDSDTRVNLRDNTLLDYVQAAKDISAEYNLPCIDNYYDLGINKDNRHMYFSPADGTHPLPAGRLLIAKNIVRYLF